MSPILDAQFLGAQLEAQAKLLLRSCGNEHETFRFCHVISCDHMIKISCNLAGVNPSL